MSCGAISFRYNIQILERMIRREITRSMIHKIANVLLEWKAVSSSSPVNACCHRARHFTPELKGSIGDGPNHSNLSDQSSVKILAKFRNFRYKIDSTNFGGFQHFLKC